MVGRLQVVKADFEKLRIYVSGLETDTDALQSEIRHVEKRTISLNRQLLVTGTCVAVTALLVISTSIWIGAQIRQAAVDKAEDIQRTNASFVEQIRLRGEQDLAELQATLAARRDALEADLTLVGTELAATGQARDEARADLEHFAELRERVGFRLKARRGYGPPECTSASAAKAGGLHMFLEFGRLPGCVLGKD